MKCSKCEKEIEAGSIVTAGKENYYSNCCNAPIIKKEFQGCSHPNFTESTDSAGDKKINDGGPAFPAKVEFETMIGNNGFAHPTGEKEVVYFSGMSLRDYFAAKAMQGEMSAQDSNFMWKKEKFTELATRCYDIADAMIKAKGEE